MTLYGGGTCIDDMKEIREDEALKKTTGIKIVPSSSAQGDWLRRASERGGIGGRKERGPHDIY